MTNVIKSNGFTSKDKNIINSFTLHFDQPVEICPLDSKLWVSCEQSVSMSADGEHNFCGMFPFQAVYVIYSCRAGRAAEPDTRLDMTMKLRFCRKVLHLLAGHRDNRQQSSWNSSSNSVHVLFKENVKVALTKQCERRIFFPEKMWIETFLEKCLWQSSNCCSIKFMLQPVHLLQNANVMGRK